LFDFGEGKNCSFFFFFLETRISTIQLELPPLSLPFFFLCPSVHPRFFLSWYFTWRSPFYVGIWRLHLSSPDPSRRRLLSFVCIIPFYSFVVLFTTVPSLHFFLSYLSSLVFSSLLPRRLWAVFLYTKNIPPDTPFPINAGGCLLVFVPVSCWSPLSLQPFFA